VTIKLQRVVVDAYSYEFSLELVIGCSISDTIDTVYGLRLYNDGSGEQEIGEIAAAHKAMVSIENKLIKMEASLRYTTDSDFPEYARRVLAACGVRAVPFEDTFNPGTEDSNGWAFESGIFGLRHG
jgi:hypothetical protein